MTFIMEFWLEFFTPFLKEAEIRGAHDKFPDFFRMGTFINNTHMKL